MFYNQDSESFAVIDDISMCVACTNFMLFQRWQIVENNLMSKSLFHIKIHQLYYK